ncbi:MAG: DHH family phosphoesterase [Pseudomonadota bacterium]|nr:DHH family phosphoesterase [Pseudomonadota bacterium]
MTDQTWKPDIVIYHDKCVDGIVAAWACWRRWGNEPAYIACNYGFAPPGDLAGKNVLMVDFSFPADVLKGMVEAGAHSIVILDHHVTAEAALAKFRYHENSPGAFGPEDITGILSCVEEQQLAPIIAFFDMNRSGARMAWDFALGTEPGRLVELAERYDLWRFQPGTGDDAEALHVEIQAGDMTIARMEELDRHDLPIERGRAILRWRDQLVMEIAQRAHRRTVAGVENVIAVECPYSLVSSVGHYLLDQHPDAPFAAMAVSGATAVTWSLRSHDDRMDVGAVAKGMGGGGHRNAAGFRMDIMDGDMAVEALKDVASRAHTHLARIREGAA